VKLDLIASQPQYHAHLDPVWDALPVKGEVIERRAVKQPQRNAVLVASGADLKRARDLGYTRIAMLEHGIGQGYLGGRSPSYPGAPGREAVSLFLAPNATASARDEAAYPKARHVIVGDPVIDTLPHREETPDDTVCVSFHWTWDGIPEMRSAFPHYRDVIPELARQFHVIGHAHPRMAGTLQRFYRKAGIEFVADFRDVCRRADVYVCDNSSTIYEFASTGRPVVLLNSPDFRRDVEHGLRFWEAATVGIQCDDPRDLAQSVQDALSDSIDQQQDREEALQLVYQPRTNAAAHAVTAILDWLADSRAIAA
jgi:hypothetical protein